LSQNKSKEEVEVAIIKDSQLHLLIDTPTAKIWREPSISGRTNSHWPFVGAGSALVEVGRGRRDLILQRHRRHHHADVAREPNLKEN
jgi:hypothetical protein